MKRAVLFSWNGSTGDVAHLASIALGLKNAGYPVQVLIPKIPYAQFKDFLAEIGISDPEVVDPSSLLEDERRKLEDEARAKGKSAEQSLRKLLHEKSERKREEVAAAIVTICRQKDDIEFVIGDATSAHLIVPARAAGIPYMQASPMPYVPTRHFFLGSRFPCVGKLGWYNLFRWRFGPTPRVWLRRVKSRITKARFQTYLRPPEDMRDEWAALNPTLTVDEASELYNRQTYHLIAASPVILGPPSDWGDNVEVAGYPAWKTSELGVSEKLQQFVSSGEPPICVGFGSTRERRFKGSEGRRFLERLARAAGECGDRIVFQSTVSSINEASDLPENVFPVDLASHEWLFPRCKAVVCHGGYGTVHTALMARTPLIIYPLQTDQFFLAKRAEQLGFALPYRARATYDRFTAQKFRSDLGELRKRSPGLRERAGAVAERIEREDPVRNHVAAIERVLQKIHRGERRAG